MQFDFVPQTMQPFMRLTQANMEVLGKFAYSPEVTAEATRNFQSFLEQAQASATSMARSDSFTALTQALLQNYTDFLAELGQSAYSLMSQGQAAFVQQAQEATSNVNDATTSRSRRAR